MLHANHKKETKNEYNIKYFIPTLFSLISIIIVIIIIFFTLSLLFYNPDDPGWSHTGKQITSINFYNKVRTWTADILLCIFGYASYLIPFMMLYNEYKKYIYRQKINLILTILHFINFLLVLIASSCFLSINIIDNKMPFGAGGILGLFFQKEINNLFNYKETNIFIIFLLIISNTFFYGMNLVYFFKNLCIKLLKLADFIGMNILKIFIKKQTKLEKNSNIELNLDKKTSIDDKFEEIKLSDDIKIEQIKDEQKVFHKTINAYVNWIYPSLSLLDKKEQNKNDIHQSQNFEKISRNVETKLFDFGIEAKVVGYYSGPVITRFELQLAAGTKVNKITSLCKDLARSLSVTSVRIVEIIPGKSVIGIELPNSDRETVKLYDILLSQQYKCTNVPLVLALGKDISGYPVIVDLAKMPHLLVAGTTGSGKSVCINAMLLSLLYKYTPKDLRLILIDPKMIELSVYNDIPHLLTPVVTNMKDSINVLKWCVTEMESRYKLMAKLGVRNIQGYNHKIRELKGIYKELPYIVVFADEYADMMTTAGKKVEELIVSITQKARAAGIHLILATQRPSVDVVTGLIKANIPTRISFQVSSKIDSRTILDQSGAEQLLGFGDMLYLPPGTGITVRIHGAFVTDEEVHRVVQNLKKNGFPEYITEIIKPVSINIDEDEE